MRVVYAALMFLLVGSVVRAEETPAIRLEAQLTLSAGTERVRALAWSPDGTRLAAGCSDRTLRIWSPDAPEPVASTTLPRYG